jgi:hypothetical protein
MAAHNSSPRMGEEYKDLITDKRVIVGDIN